MDSVSALVEICNHKHVHNLELILCVSVNARI